jgi:hypothetical protein
MRAGRVAFGVRAIATRVHAPHPPSVASALSGFVVGVVVTLFATGVFNLGSTPSAIPPPPTAPVVPVSTLRTNVQKLVTKQLGPGYPNPNRLISLLVLPVRPANGSPESITALARYRSLYIEYRLLDHPLRAWRLKTAKSEVFSLLHALYTSGLPVYNVELDGRFMLPDHGQIREERALFAYIDFEAASRIPWRSWGREHEGQVWNLLPVKSVDPRFA